MGLVCSGLCCLGQCACCAVGCCKGGGKKTGSEGRWGSLILMILAMGLSMLVQYWAGNFFAYYAFEDGCRDSHACQGVAGVYRVSLVTALFFMVMATIGHSFPSFHDSFWNLKFLSWMAGLCIAWFVPNPIFFGYIWVARVGAFLFVILQQVLLIDLAYYVNDKLVTMADQGTKEECCGMAWPLLVLLAMAFTCFIVAITGIALLFSFFGVDCESPNLILSLTIILIIIAVLSQLFVSKDSNLLTSSFISVYAVYLATAALSANPVDKCNPFYNTSSDWLSIVLGISLTVLVLLYTIYSATYNVKYLQHGRGEKQADNAPGGALMKKILTGALPEGTTAADATAQDDDHDDEENATGRKTNDDPPPKTGAEVASFNIVLGLMAMNVAMVTTNWGSTHRGATEATSPSSGKIAMFMQAAAQWAALALYIWTCVAPTLFPDRDFS